MEKFQDPQTGTSTEHGWHQKYYDKEIFIQSNTTYVYIYIIINTQLATYFGSSEPYSGQFLTYRHGAFSECAHYVRTHRLYIKNWPEDGSLEPKHVANYVLMIIHICCV